MIFFILGTRPEIIKMAPIIRACKRKKLDYFILHTGQHYSYEMDSVFFKEMELREADYNLDVGSGNHAKQTAKMMIGIEKILIKEKPKIILVEGDTNTVLASALTASKLTVKIGHVEAGLRSNDKNMPEEINRIITDHVSDYLFAPTEISKKNLIKESIDPKKIYITGNSIVDAVFQNLEIAKRKTDVLKRYNLKPKNYFLITAHRQENVDKKQKLSKILNALEKISNEYSIPMIFSIHPRTSKRIETFKLKTSGVMLIKPVGYLDFLVLEANARLILTDSGGVQEESCILHVPCITLRDNTERPETIDVGANKLVGTEPEIILKGVNDMLKEKIDWKNPFGDGKTGERIIEIIKEKIN
ncbi:MAG: non-hydrolyzing UDP-N-acetylglucosamine 2-epimerase [Candidatus Helarchaeota archaeon]